jgi:3-deoxy-D-manno-octulosonic-acid transferase
MNLLYTFSIRCYAGLLWLFQGFNTKAKSWVKGRVNFWDNLPVKEYNNLHWFHCASLGEFDQGIPLMNELKKNDPSIEILVTFFSPSGMEHYQKRKHCADYVYYLPIDTPKNAKRFLNYFSPTRIFFIKYEFWINYLLEAKSRATPLYSVSCILRPSQIYFKWYGSFFRKGLHCFDTFFVQNQETKELLNNIHIQSIEITGDTRFDKVIENKELVQQDVIIEDFLKNSKAIILGSSWPVEESLFREYLQKNTSNQKIIIAPHDISESHINHIENLFEGKTTRYSNPIHSKQILIIDCIGKLANAYSYGKIAFIGGGFTGKLHNTLEPIVFGLPVIFGPKHSKFPEAQQFIDTGIGFSISDCQDFTAVMQTIETNLAELKLKCNTEIQNSKGASLKIVNKLNSKTL